MKVAGWQMEAAYRASCPVPFKGIPDILRSHIDLMVAPFDRQFAERCDADPEFIQAALGVIRMAGPAERPTSTSYNGALRTTGSLTLWKAQSAATRQLLLDLLVTWKTTCEVKEMCEGR